MRERQRETFIEFLFSLLKTFFFFCLISLSLLPTERSFVFPFTSCSVLVFLFLFLFYFCFFLVFVFVFLLFSFTPPCFVHLRRVFAKFGNSIILIALFSLEPISIHRPLLNIQRRLSTLTSVTFFSLSVFPRLRETDYFGGGFFRFYFTSSFFINSNFCFLVFSSEKWRQTR